MSLGIAVDNRVDDLGSPAFLHAFFSTISGNLEPQWGVRFPVLMHRFYQGELAPAELTAAREELALVQNELSDLSPDRLIWDIDDPTKQPPWGQDIASDITDLSTYFITAAGRDLFAVLFEAIDEALAGGTFVRIV